MSDFINIPVQERLNSMKDSKEKEIIKEFLKREYIKEQESKVINNNRRKTKSTDLIVKRVKYNKRDN
jgi:Na+-translocating ferredoxin:NAD+ oxidoreductase RnfG subunit